jgi:hypothetical protein
MSNLDKHTTPIELSQEQLDQISGGIDIFLSGSMFQQRDIFSSRRRGSRRRGFGSSSIFQSSYISSSAFQFIGLGFDSVSDAMGFVRGFMRLFGGR